MPPKDGKQASCPIPSAWVTGLARSAPEVLEGALRNGRFNEDAAACVQQELVRAEAQRAKAPAG